MTVGAKPQQQQKLSVCPDRREKMSIPNKCTLHRINVKE